METIAAAFVAAVGAAVVAVIESRRTRRAIGKPNGKGTVVEMLEDLIEWKGAHEAEHQKLHQCPLVQHVEYDR